MAELLQQLSTALTDRYAIERKIGEGGMATVYLARDVKHDRRVAVKVLNPDLAIVLGADRFLSEIRVTANLQHPNLLPLFDSGEANGLLYYVMPYVQGESLRATLDRVKQLPVDDAVHIATAVASALDYAHRLGVIHRDLKPENILLSEGQPLVADFGIALAVSNAGGSRVTQTGISLGTPQYMSPEQATSDRVIDGRSDIYSLGAVLYEMLTGEPPHMGHTSQAIIARVLTETPRGVRIARPSVPEHVEAAVHHALEKLPADRFATGHELADALMGRTDSAVFTTSTKARRAMSRETRQLATLLAVAFLSVGLGGAAMWAWNRDAQTAPRTTVRFQIVIPPEQVDIVPSPFTPFAIAPDGNSFVYRAGVEARRPPLYIRRLDQVVGQLVPGTDSAYAAAFSPDGRWLAFAVWGQVRKIRIGDAAPMAVAAIAGFTPGLAWGESNLVYGGSSGPLYTVPVDGGAASQLTMLDSATHEVWHASPVMLPDLETVLFTVVRATAQRRIGVVSLKTRKRVTLNLDGHSPLGIVSGLLIYHDGRGSLLGVPVDPGGWKVTGTAIPLVDDVASATNGFARAALSPSGSLAYVVGSESLERELVEVDMNGTERVVAPMRSSFMYPRYSPDGRHIAVTLSGSRSLALEGELWVYDIASQTLTPVAREGDASRAEWTPDGRSLIYSARSKSTSRFSLLERRADGTDSARLLQQSGPTGDPVQGVITADGRFLIYRTGYHPPTDDLWYRALSGDTTSKALAAMPEFTERNPALSFDGQWVAYASNESGSEQIYVRRFPGPGPRFAVTVNGGNEPVWSRDGRKLYYRAGSNIEEATIVTAPRFSVKRRVLFASANVDDPWHRSFDIAPDGKRFIMVRAVGAEKLTSYFVHNWDVEVRARRAALATGR